MSANTQPMEARIKQRCSHLLDPLPPGQLREPVRRDRVRPVQRSSQLPGERLVQGEGAIGMKSAAAADAIWFIRERGVGALHRQSRDQEIIVFSCRQRAIQRLGDNVLPMTDCQL